MKKKPPLPPGKEKNTLPRFIEKALGEKGNETAGALYACTGDMDAEACYKDLWMFFDPKGLYLAFCREETVKPGRGHVPPEPKITVEKSTAVPSEEIDSLSIERYTSTGRLIMSCGADSSPLT